MSTRRGKGSRSTPRGARRGLRGRREAGQAPCGPRGAPLLLSQRDGRPPPPVCISEAPRVLSPCRLRGLGTGDPCFGSPRIQWEIFQGTSELGEQRRGAGPSGEQLDGVLGVPSAGSGSEQAGGPSDVTLELEGRVGSLEVRGGVGGRGLAGQRGFQAMGGARGGLVQEAGGGEEQAAQRLGERSRWLWPLGCPPRSCLPGAAARVALSPPPGLGSFEALRPPPGEKTTFPAPPAPAWTSTPFSRVWKRRAT